MPAGHSSDMDPEAQYKATRRIDQAYLANKTFQSNQWQLSFHSALTHLPLLLVIYSSLPVAHLLLAPTPLPLCSPPPTPSMAIDINTTWKLYLVSLKGYYRCKDINHLVKDCFYQMDIRLLMAEQQEELIEDLLALKDVVSKEENPLVEEDFA